MTTDEEKRWIVIGIAMNKVVAPILRDYIKKRMDTHYTKLDTNCGGLTTPCTLQTLTHRHVTSDPFFKPLKFQNINNNFHLHGRHKYVYNYRVTSSVDLAKLYLPDYLAEFSAFDESLDLSAILRLLGISHPAPIFPSPSNSIQSSADDVRQNVRNKWGHCNITDWTEVLFNDCFSKLENLVRSLALTPGMEKFTLGQLYDWQTKGCQLCMGHAVDQNLLSLVQQDVKELIKNYRKSEAEQSSIRESLDWQKTEQIDIQTNVASLQDQQCSTRNQLEIMESNIQLLEKLVAVEKTLSEELLLRVQELEEGLSNVKSHISQTDQRVKMLAENDVRQRMKAASPVEPFDVKRCRSKLAEYYMRTATVPTSVWSKKSPVNIHQIYTRLSWIREEQTPVGSSRSELTHYTDVLTKDEKGAARNRILVQGQTGIGKTTFVKKLAVDWAELDNEETRDKQKDALSRLKLHEETSRDNVIASQNYEDSSSETEYQGLAGNEYDDTSREKHKDMSEIQKSALTKFELVLIINLKEVSKFQSLRDIICHCNIFPEEETALAEQLLDYITKNQEKVLLVFDGYDEYRCGRNSEIYDIFRGKKLRNCYVLITTRISKADELLEFKDVHAEITGFSEEDKVAFMSRMLGDETEANELMDHLKRKNLKDLARVPLLLLFFCTLWKKEKLKSFAENKTKLYLGIVQYVLDHNQGKHSPALFGKIQDSKETHVLAEIGNLALECLLKDDHVFEYDQLSAAILCEESCITGLRQVTEYAENLRPGGMVSFIHKSIQEFLAAWYITYRCVPEGHLGGIEEHTSTLDDCEDLENVFQFICGLSDDGAVKILKHLEFVRVSNPELDLSKTIPLQERIHVPNETDFPLCDVTYKNERFYDLVYNSFQEVHSKTELLNRCLDCTGGILLVTSRRNELLQKMKNDLTQFLHSGVLFFIVKDEIFASNYLYGKANSILLWLIEFLNCHHVPVRITESSELSTLGDFSAKFQNVGRCSTCSFTSILCFRNGEPNFYITGLRLDCNDHTGVITETTATSAQSLSTNSYSKPFCLKFLRSLRCYIRVNDERLKALGGVIRNCYNLKSIEIESSKDCICDLLESVPKPGDCSLKIGNCYGYKCHLTSAGAERLASLLPRFTNIIRLILDLSGCCAAAVETLVSRVDQRTLEEIELSNVSLTPAAATSLGRSLPEMSSLRTLQLTGVVGSILQAEEMDALFDGFKKTLPLRLLNMSGFRVRGCLAPLTKSLCFFPTLQYLTLTMLNMDKSDLHGLLESFRFIPSLWELDLSRNPLGHAVTSIVPQVLNLPKLELFDLSQTASEEDLNYVRETVKQARPHLDFFPD